MGIRTLIAQKTIGYGLPRQCAHWLAMTVVDNKQSVKFKFVKLMDIFYHINVSDTRTVTIGIPSGL